MTSKDPWFETALTTLADPQDQRVWSVIVTLFGDLAQDPGAQISGGALTRVIEPLGIKPEAIRVALHRLRKDGWIDSDRVGRVSRHFLTEYGRRQSAAVTPRIYAPRSVHIPEWHILIAPDGGLQILDELLLSHDYMPLSRNIALGPGPAPDHPDELLAMTITASHTPKWVQNRLCPTERQTSCRELFEAVKAAGLSRPANWTPTAAQIATLRTLIVHRWRRVVLRQPDLPDQFYPPNWVGPECRHAVIKMLDTLPRPPLEVLNQAE